jgi:hypothetical protein
MIFGLQFTYTTKVGGMNILSLPTHNKVLLIQFNQVPIYENNYKFNPSCNMVKKSNLQPIP